MKDSTGKTELWVGMFVFIGLSLLGGLIVHFGSFGDRWRGEYEFVVVFEDASGLIKGSEVRMGGARIGKVAKAPELNSEVKVQVVMSIDDMIRIPEDSQFQVASVSLLGDKMVVITPPPGGTAGGGHIEPGSVVSGGGPSGLEAIQNNAEALSRDARRLLVKAGETFGKIDLALDDFRGATGRLATTLDKVNGSILSEHNLNAVDATLANLENVAGKLEPVMDDARSAILAVEKAAAGAEETFASANEWIEELEPALEEVPKAVASLARAADKAGRAIDRVDDGEGLLGTLAHDREVSEDAKTFIRNLKQQGILRYRDKDTPQEDPRNRFRGRRR